jgi:hypothetical protein
MDSFTRSKTTDTIQHPWHDLTGLPSPLIHYQANILHHGPARLMHLPADGDMVRHHGL